MSGEKSTGNKPDNQGSSSANKGSGKSNRRRSVRSKRRSRKPEASGESRTQPNAPKSAEKSVRENRDRRRRRRMRAKQRSQNETPTPVVENTLKDLPPLVPAFVYTHVLRPSTRDSFEFRTEHFSKVTRKLEDFHIDLSPLYPDGGDEIKGVGYMPPETDAGEFGEKFTRDNDEVYEDLDWDAEESEDAMRLDGAIADEFYDDLGDTVDDAADEAAPEDDAGGLA